MTLKPLAERRDSRGIRPLLGLELAHRQDQVVGLAREDCRGSPTISQQSDPRGVPALDLSAVVRGRARHQCPGFLLDPAEGGDVLVRPEQNSGLAGSGLRREVDSHSASLLVRVLGQPARHRGRVAVPHCALEHRQREAVDLEEGDARTVGLDTLLPSDARDAG